MKYVYLLTVLICFLIMCSCGVSSKKKELFNETSYKNSYLNMKGISVDSVNTFSKEELLNTLFTRENTNLIDSLKLKNENYLVSKNYIVSTKTKKYNLVFFQNTDIFIRDNYVLIIKEISNSVIYIIEDCYSNDLFRIGDYNDDGYLDYAEIDEQNSMLRFYTLKNGKKSEIEKLKLKSVYKKGISEGVYYIK
jgi:hypothetical protein